MRGEKKKTPVPASCGLTFAVGERDPPHPPPLTPVHKSTQCPPGWREEVSKEERKEERGRGGWRERKRGGRKKKPNAHERVVDADDEDAADVVQARVVHVAGDVDGAGAGEGGGHADDEAPRRGGPELAPQVDPVARRVLDEHVEVGDRVADGDGRASRAVELPLALALAPALALALALLRHLLPRPSGRRRRRRRPGGGAAEQRRRGRRVAGAGEGAECHGGLG